MILGIIKMMKEEYQNDNLTAPFRKLLVQIGARKRKSISKRMGNKLDG